MKKLLMVMGVAGVLLAAPPATAGCKNSNFEGEWFTAFTLWDNTTADGDSTTNTLRMFNCVLELNEEGSNVGGISRCYDSQGESVRVNSIRLQVDTTCEITGIVDIDGTSPGVSENNIRQGNLGESSKAMLLTGADQFDRVWVGNGFKSPY